MGNRLTASITDATGTRDWSYTYDNRDRLIRERKPDGSTLEYGYDLRGNKVRLSVSYLNSSSYSETYSYDVLNRLSTVTDRHGQVTTYAYDAVGNRESMIHGNATITHYRYDPLNRLTDLSHQTGLGGELLSYSYELHATGRRTKITESSGRVTDYSYDDLYRLIHEEIADSVNGNYSATYQYDAVGNRRQEVVNGVTTAYQYDQNDWLLQTGGTTYTYDANGNTLTEQLDGQTKLYSYNSQNELISTTQSGMSTEYQYNVDGLSLIHI